MLQPAKKRLRGPYRELRRKYLRLRSGFGPDDLRRLLRENGVSPGDAVLVHSGMSGFEGFRGNLSDIIGVFQEAVGRGGTLLMPTLSMAGSALDYARSNRIFDANTTPSQVGLLTEVFRRSPDVKRSIHPTHSVAVWGADQDWWIANHHLSDTPCGRGTPWERLWERDGKIVLAGVPIAAMTYFHCAEEHLEPRMPASPFTTERYAVSCRVDKQIIESAPMRLYDPQISRRRNLAPLDAELRRTGRWREIRAGTLTAPVLRAREVLQALEEMADRGTFCYDSQ